MMSQWEQCWPGKGQAGDKGLIVMQIVGKEGLLAFQPSSSSHQPSLGGCGLCCWAQTQARGLSAWEVTHRHRGQECPCTGPTAEEVPPWAGHSAAVSPGQQHPCSAPCPGHRALVQSGAAGRMVSRQPLETEGHPAGATVLQQAAGLGLPPAWVLMEQCRHLATVGETDTSSCVPGLQTKEQTNAPIP